MQRAAPLPRSRGVSELTVADASSEHLLALVAQGRDDALAELYDRYGKLAYALALRVLRDPHFAEDAVQEAFVAAWRSAPAFAATRGSARSWILTLVHRRAVDRVRREQRQLETTAEAAQPEAAAEAPSFGERTSVRKALMRLAPGERRMLALAYYEGLTQTEIAKVLDIPLGTVKSGTARALGRLASLLDDGRGAAGARRDED